MISGGTSEEREIGFRHVRAASENMDCRGGNEKGWARRIATKRRKQVLGNWFHRKRGKERESGVKQQDESKDRL